MSWVRLDDGFAAHPKIANLNDNQFRVWVRVLCHCGRYRSPVIDEGTRKAVLGLDLRVQKSFISAGLIDSVGGELRVHDWELYQPNDSTGAERQARWRKNRNAEVTAGVTVENVTGVTPPSRPVLEDIHNLSELRDVAPTEAEIVAAREKRQRAGYIENLGSYTGCRYVRGQFGLTAKYDPLGTEPPPNEWPYERPTREEISAALKAEAAPF